MQIVSASPERFLQVLRRRGRGPADQRDAAPHGAARGRSVRRRRTAAKRKRPRRERDDRRPAAQRSLARLPAGQRPRDAALPAGEPTNSCSTWSRRFAGTLRAGRDAARSVAGGLSRRFDHRCARRCGRWRSSPSWSRPPAGPYCGSLGYLGFDGTLDTSILIRTITAGRGWWQFPVGGGIVAQSDPAREYEETWHKAEGLLRALCSLDEPAGICQITMVASASMARRSSRSQSSTHCDQRIGAAENTSRRRSSVGIVLGVDGETRGADSGSCGRSYRIAVSRADQDTRRARLRLCRTPARRVETFFDLFVHQFDAAHLIQAHHGDRKRSGVLGALAVRTTGYRGP